MSELNPELAGSLLEVCREGAGETAEALARALGGTFAVNVDEPSTFAASGAAAELDGPGLALLFQVGAAGLAAVLLTRGPDLRIEQGTAVDMVFQREIALDLSRAH